jgi:hypothetical protein
LTLDIKELEEEKKQRMNALRRDLSSSNVSLSSDGQDFLLPLEKVLQAAESVSSVLSMASLSFPLSLFSLSLSLSLSLKISLSLFLSFSHSH